MATRRVFAQGLASLILVAALSGCKDNFDVKVPGEGALICVKIGAKNAPTEADLRSQVAEWNPEPTTLERHAEEDAGGFNIWILKIEIPFAPHEAIAGEQVVHVGIGLNDGAEWKRMDVVVSDVAHPTPPMAALVEEKGSGRHLAVTNGSSTTHLQIDHLQVAVSSVNYSLQTLTYDDPLIVALPWQTVISSPTTLSLGETQNFPISGSPIPDGYTCYLRAIYTNSGGSLGPLGTVQSLTAPHGLPVLGPWGMSLVALFVSGGAAAVLSRRRRPGR